MGVNKTRCAPMTLNSGYSLLLPGGGDSVVTLCSSRKKHDRAVAAGLICPEDIWGAKKVSDLVAYALAPREEYPPLFGAMPVGGFPRRALAGSNDCVQIAGTKNQ